MPSRRRFAQGSLLFGLTMLAMVACSSADESALSGGADPAMASASSARAESDAGVRVGAPAPAYAVATLAGDSLVIGSRTDALTLVNVWATWCVSCKEEFAFMDELLARYEPDGLRIVAVSVDVGAVAPVERVARQYGVTFEIAHDPEGRIEAAYPAIGVPASYLVGRDGRLLWKHVGVLPPSVAEVIAATLGTERTAVVGTEAAVSRMPPHALQ